MKTFLNYKNHTGIFLIALVMIGCSSCTPVDDNDDIVPPPTEKPNEFFSIPYATISVRDPFVLVDTATNAYYIHSNGGGKTVVHKSKDLIMWRKYTEPSFLPNNDFWGKKDFWAPDVYKYNGKYYLYITVSNQTQKRGTTTLVSEKPDGPFEPLTNQAVTPKDWMCLDGSLYVDSSNQPWILYCYEWLEAVDGKIYAQKLSNDLKVTIDDPVLLFKASEAPWVGFITTNNGTGLVTDAPFLYTLDDGTLIMLWSSFDKTGKYAIGQATSTSGLISGPWVQHSSTLNTDNGGHAMLFKDLNGKLRISYHSPNNANWKLTIKDASFENNILKIGKSIQ